MSFFRMRLYGLPLDYLNTTFLLALHASAVYAGYHLWNNPLPQTLFLGAFWFLLCGISIGAGYHRLFAHQAYTAASPIRIFYLLFGAASAQTSALQWAANHRAHHHYTDKEGDPYNISKSFFWAHVGWVLVKTEPPRLHDVRDLESDPLVVLQNRFYFPIAICFGGLLPTLIAWAWGDPWGGFLSAGILRLTAQYHCTFAVNSFAHTFGSRPYTAKNSARDSWWVALITFGEGFHNFHHCFLRDYRSGIRWFHFDPVKWWVWLLAQAGFAENLFKTNPLAISAAKRRTIEAKA